MLRRYAILLFLILPVSALAGTQAAASQAKPVIQKVDPPDWWVNMTGEMATPMLLLHGEHFDDAKFSVSSGVKIARSLVSPNGHWAFLWISIAARQPLTVHISASNIAGSAAYDFPLQARKPASAGFQGFSSRDVIYLIMTDRFADGDTSNNAPANDPDPIDRSKPRGWHGGDFRGIEQHLDYLQQLGVTTLWTTPAYNNNPSPQAYHGYSATDMYSVDPHFGTLADYQHLAAAAHARGLKMVLDTVPNHVGPRHPWTIDPPTPDWFHGTVAHHDVAEGNFQSIPDPHAARLNSRDVTEGWFANILPDMNQENALVAQYLIQNAVWWVESAGLDGLRLDTFPYVGRAFWHDFHMQLHSLYPHLTTVGEVFNRDPVITSYFAGGPEHSGIDTGLDTPFDFPIYFTLRDVFIRKAPVTTLANMLGNDWLYPHPERLVPFLGNHDTTRFLSEPGADIAGLKLAFAVLATLRGTPQIYSGDEIAMRGGEDPDNRHDFPGGFPGDPASAFTDTGRAGDQQEVFDWASQLFRLRALHSALQTGALQTVFVDTTAIAYLRTDDLSRGCSPGSSEHLLAIVNNSDAGRDLTFELNDTALSGCTGFTSLLSSPVRSRIEGSRLHISMAARQFVLLTASAQ